MEEAGVDPIAGLQILVDSVSQLHQPGEALRPRLRGSAGLVTSWPPRPTPPLWPGPPRAAPAPADSCCSGACRTTHGCLSARQVTRRCGRRGRLKGSGEWHSGPSRGRGGGQLGVGQTFRAAAMSMFSSVSKGQLSKAGWKSCNLLRHLDRGQPLTAAAPPPRHPPAPGRHPLQQKLQAVHGCAVGGREIVSQLAQQPQPELGEGREAVSQALLLGTQGPSELTLSRPSPRVGVGEQPVCKGLLQPSTGLALLLPPTASGPLHHQFPLASGQRPLPRSLSQVKGTTSLSWDSTPSPHLSSAQSCSAVGHEVCFQAHATL